MRGIVKTLSSGYNLCKRFFIKLCLNKTGAMAFSDCDVKTLLSPV